jgi:hypothetical protein
VGRRVALLLAGLLFVVGPSHAQRFEIVPFVGFRLNGAFTDKTTDQRLEFDESTSFGFLASMDLDGDSKLEFYYSHQETEVQPKNSDTTLLDMDVDYFQLVGLYQWDQKPLTPFINVGIGAARWEPPDLDVDAEFAFSFSVGGGAKAYFKKPKWLGLRFDARGIGTAFSGGSELFCDSTSTCFDIKGTVVWQWEATAGLLFAF